MSKEVDHGTKLYFKEIAIKMDEVLKVYDLDELELMTFLASYFGFIAMFNGYEKEEFLDGFKKVIDSMIWVNEQGE